MQYLSLNDDINKLPLSVILAYNLKHNGINTIADIMRIKADKSYKNFVWHVSEIAEIEHWLNNLNTGCYGYILSEPELFDEDKKISQEICESYKIKPAISINLIQEIRRNFPDSQGESFIDNLYKRNKILLDALHDKIIAILDKHENGANSDNLTAEIPEHLRNSTVTANMLISMQQNNELVIKNDLYLRSCPSFIDYVKSLDNDRNRNMMLERLSVTALLENESDNYYAKFYAQDIKKLNTSAKINICASSQIMKSHAMTSHSHLMHLSAHLFIVRPQPLIIPIKSPSSQFYTIKVYPKLFEFKLNGQSIKTIFLSMVSA